MNDIPEIPSEPEKQNKPRFPLFRWLRNRFLTGVVVAVPIAVTIWLITSFVRIVDEQVLSLVSSFWDPDVLIRELTGLSIPGTGIVIAFLFLVILGVFTSNFIGNSVLAASEYLFSRVPFVSSIYGALKQIVTAVVAQGDQAFKEVCLIEYPRKGLWAIGFVTSGLKGAPLEYLTDDFVCVFVPTTPNPTSGFLLLTKRRDIRILNMTPEEGAKMIISGGMVPSDADSEAATPESSPKSLDDKRKV
ncbi:MAG: DUF502 domain-containing protein [Hyphomonadaceae bacterium]|nr:DUF502 domain-containing protein [Hyphomonadaceae bacterium]